MINKVNAGKKVGSLAEQVFHNVRFKNEGGDAKWTISNCIQFEYEQQKYDGDGMEWDEMGWDGMGNIAAI